MPPGPENAPTARRLGLAGAGAVLGLPCGSPIGRGPLPISCARVPLAWGDRMHSRLWKRRAFITLLGGAAAWPLAAQAQQSPIPVVGFLHFSSPSVYGPRIAAFREALSAAGYVEGKNVIIDFRPATNVHDFQQIALQLVASNVSLIVASGSEAVSATRQACGSLRTPVPVLCALADAHKPTVPKANRR